MPYIEQAQRVEIDKWLDEFNLSDVSCGALNYIITKLLLKSISSRPRVYQDYNDLIGVLECAKLELYRRCVAPYEDQKRNQNREVY